MTKARLCVFAALHDIGKVNVGFQTRIWQDKDLQGRRRPNWAGHTSDIVPVLQGIDWDTSDWFLKGIGWHEHIGNWDGDGGKTASALFAAAMSHHGEPLNLHDSKNANPDVWRAFGALDPQACVRRVGGARSQVVPCRIQSRWAAASFSSPVPAHVPGTMHSGRLDRIGRRTLPFCRRS